MRLADTQAVGKAEHAAKGKEEGEQHSGEGEQNSSDLFVAWVNQDFRTEAKAEVDGVS